VGVLRPSLRALALYYPLAGRLVWAGLDGCLPHGHPLQQLGVPSAAVEAGQSLRESLGDSWRERPGVHAPRASPAAPPLDHGEPPRPPNLSTSPLSL